MWVLVFEIYYNLGATSVRSTGQRTIWTFTIYCWLELHTCQQFVWPCPWEVKVGIVIEFLSRFRKSFCLRVIDIQASLQRICTFSDLGMLGCRRVMVFFASLPIGDYHTENTYALGPNSQNTSLDVPWCKVLELEIALRCNVQIYSAINVRLHS